MNLTILDFETYFDRQYSLKKQTIPEYVFDPRFHVHGLAIRLPDGVATFRIDVEESLEELKQQFGQQLERTTVVCHHAHFDGYILNHKYGLRPRNFIDTLLLANHVHGPRLVSGQAASLHALARRYGLGEKGELDFMCGVRHPDARQLVELARYAKQDTYLTEQLVRRLLPEISRPEVEIPIAMHTIRLFTERGIHVDVSGISDLEHQVREEVELHLKQAGVTREQVSHDKQFLTLLASALARSGRKVPMKMGKHKEIPATAKKDPQMQAFAADVDPVVAALACARLGKKGEDQKLARLGTLRRIAAATGGMLPPCLVYFGSHTGRFSGSGGFNIQNLAKSGLGGRTRHLLVPQPGNVFVIADLAQIEARITAWIAGETLLIDEFKNGSDVYSEFASRTFGQPVRKTHDGDPPELRDRLTALREVGKQAVLGLGYQMGALEFMKQLRAKPLVAPLFDTGQLSPSICHQIVQTFRDEYSRISRMWPWLDEAMRHTIDSVGSKTDRINIERVGTVTKVWLPSGRALRYENLRLGTSQQPIRYLGSDGMEHKHVPGVPSMIYGREAHIYGGKLCENIAQATARDLLVEAILRLEAIGLRVLFHVHDELIIEVDEAGAESVKHTIKIELCRQPTWATELPLECEVQIAKRYTK